MTTTETVATAIRQGEYRSDPDHSTVTFSTRHFGIGTFRGTFGDTQVTLTVDNEGQSIAGTAKVESMSIRTPDKFREQMLSADFFDAESHPVIEFRSSSLDLDADGTAVLDGELVIKGIAKPLRATGTWRGPIEDPYGKHRLALDVDALVDRRDWDMSWQALLPKGGEQAVGWKIALEARLELIEETAS
jgi:polyisoprenoid-binding protein YceI